MKCPECGSEELRTVWSVPAQAEVALLCTVCGVQAETRWTKSPLDLADVNRRIEQRRWDRAMSELVGPETTGSSVIGLVLFVMLVVVVMVMLAIEPADAVYCC